jgi:lipopolysaccharide transport system permease protein
MRTLFRYRELIRNLVLKDLKLKYRGSTLGFLWSLANPLLVILVYSFVFTRMLRSDIPNFGYFLLVGILPWNFFAQSLMMSTGAVIDNGNLIKKVWLPIEVFPITTVLFNLAQFLLALLVLLPAAIVYFKSSLTWSWLAFVPILSLQVLFTLGLCFFFSTATVFYRDVKHFTEILLMLLFWLTPVVYNLRALPESLRHIVYMNPVSFFIAAYQDILYLGVFPGVVGIVAMLLLSFTSLGLGYLFFVTCKARFPEEI